jgi:hypothetical protein
MKKNKASPWKTVFLVTTFMGGVFLVTKPGGPLSTTFRITLVLVGIIGYIVVSNRESRRHDLNTAEGETERVNDIVTDKRGNPYVGRLFLVIGILFAVLVGIFLLARSTLPK